ncbi:MAG: D-glycero-beta-D-manno-heptose 1,7-bisphosphate 7-phosphatase [Methyloprofundus sp.]|nr:D-glycero-beta-D-manno-heptose 1,7-bisphosphate 7-phosphatase [Methyloprofundus sp.]
MKKALFLDRDGVINREKNYLYKIADFEFIDGLFSTCQYFQEQGYLLIIITNQAGIARGKYTENDFACLNDWMLKQFSNQGILISKVYYCPHHPEFSGECHCRKPNPGMILQAQQAFDLDLSKSILIGDKKGDIQAGINANVAHNILVRSGHPIDETNTAARVVIDSIADLPEVFAVS